MSEKLKLNVERAPCRSKLVFWSNEAAAVMLRKSGDDAGQGAHVLLASTRPQR
jgi:hypothetical protein